MRKMISSVLSFFLSLFVFMPVFAEEYPAGVCLGVVPVLRRRLRVQYGALPEGTGEREAFPGRASLFSAQASGNERGSLFPKKKTAPLLPP